MGSSSHRITLAKVTIVLILGTTTVPAETETAPTKSFEVRREAQTKDFCIGVNGKYANKKIPPAQLLTLLDKHQAWLRTYDTEEERKSGTAKNDPRRANLCGSDLSGAYLWGANLSGADLSVANLSKANLSVANLSGADLSVANLSGADLSRANLSGADLLDANLSGASLFYANLSKANLWVANLSKADLLGANLSGASLTYANLSDARFELIELPLQDTIATADNLDQMYYDENPQALIKLRKAFKEAGYTQQERAITSAIKLSEQWRGKAVWDKVEGVFKYVFFDLPTQWGMYPGRALRVLVILMGVFALPYIFALRYPNSGRIYRKWGTNNTPTVATSTTSGERCKTAALPEGTEVLQYRWMHSIFTGLQFSLLSAFHIGFRELNVGNWISRLQARDYTLYATGWVRSVAGTQSLISVYLLAMWTLTYFGRPFE